MRSDARETAFKIVFARLLGGDCGQGYRSALYRAAKLNDDDKAYAERLVSLVAEKGEELTAAFMEKVERFAEYRIYPADKAALLVALAEIRYFDDIPPVVSVNEATSLASRYSTERSADFVNGVLGGIINA